MPGPGPPRPGESSRGPGRRRPRPARPRRPESGPAAVGLATPDQENRLECASLLSPTGLSWKVQERNILHCSASKAAFARAQRLRPFLLSTNSHTAQAMPPTKPPPTCPPISPASPQGSCPATPPAEAPAKTAIRSTSKRGLLIKPSSAPASPPTAPPTGTAIATSPTSTPRRCQILCITLMPAAPPKSIQKLIMRAGAKTGGIGVGDLPASGTTCWVPYMMVFPPQTAGATLLPTRPTDAAVASSPKAVGPCSRRFLPFGYLSDESLHGLDFGTDEEPGVGS